MLTVSLHGISIHAPLGLYPEEKITGNDFEIDVDIVMPVGNSLPLPFVDYVIIENVVSSVFKLDLHTLEALAIQVHKELKLKITEAGKIKVAIRKLHPPIPDSTIRYAQIIYEQ